MQELSHYINGAHVKGTSSRFSDVYNPATGEVQAKLPLADASELDKAVHPVQLPCDDPDVDVCTCDCVRQCVHPEAVRA